MEWLGERSCYDQDEHFLQVPVLHISTLLSSKSTNTNGLSCQGNPSDEYYNVLVPTRLSYTHLHIQSQNSHQFSQRALILELCIQLQLECLITSIYLVVFFHPFCTKMRFLDRHTDPLPNFPSPQVQGEKKNPWAIWIWRGDGDTSFTHTLFFFCLFPLVRLCL